MRVVEKNIFFMSENPTMFLSLIFLLLTVLVLWVGGLLFVCLLLHVTALCFKRYRRSSAPNIDGLTRAEFVWFSLLSVVFIWRLTYFASAVCFQGGLPSCPQTARRPRPYKILRFTSVHSSLSSLPRCCDEIPTERPGYAVGWAGGLLPVQGRPRVRIPALKGETVANFSNASVLSGACTFPSPRFSGKVQQGVYGLPRESPPLLPTLGSAAYSSAPSHSLVQRSRFARLQRRRLFCRFSNHPVALGLARDDLLAGAPALDAYFIEGERASAPMEIGTNGFWGWSLWVSRTFFLCVSRSSSQAT